MNNEINEIETTNYEVLYENSIRKSIYKENERKFLNCNNI